MDPAPFFEVFAFEKKKFDHDQEDAHEAILFILERLHECFRTGQAYRENTRRFSEAHRKIVNASIAQMNRTTTYSPINEFFMIQFYQRTQCCQCQTISERFPIAYELLLPLNEKTAKQDLDIYDLLNNFSERELMTGEEAYHCEKCCAKCSDPNSGVERCTKTQAYKKTKLFRLPPCLIIVLGRFNCFWDSRINNMREEKNEQFIEYPVELHLSKWVKYPQAHHEVYDLYAVNYHIGVSTHGGHYYAGVKADDVWCNMNDSLFEYMDDPKDLINDQAYILFYQRKK
jgi:ubiquitin C-terminal hydrolase